MKFATLLVLGLVGLAASTKPVPTFTWLHKQFSPDGVPLLAVDFHDGKPSDVIILKRVNPLPRQPTETEESIDKCLFHGHLRDEENVFVALTGGCPFEDKFEIQMRSQRNTEFMFKMTRGEVQVLESVYKQKTLINDIALKPPTNKMAKRKNPPLRSSYTLNVAMNYDLSFSGGFGGDEYNTIRRVVTQAQYWYNHPTLTHDFQWNIAASGQIPLYIEASEADLRTAGNYNGNYNTNVYMCYQNSAGGTVGIAWVGTICGAQNYRTAVVEYFNSDSQSGEILAHEVGHNLGMSHDFVGSPGNPRYDSQGRSCTNIGGVMDYYQTVSKWSTCSVEDFEDTFHGCLN